MVIGTLGSVSVWGPMGGHDADQNAPRVVHGLWLRSRLDGNSPAPGKLGGNTLELDN